MGTRQTRDLLQPLVRIASGSRLLSLHFLSTPGIIRELEIGLNGLIKSELVKRRGDDDEYFTGRTSPSEQALAILAVSPVSENARAGDHNHYANPLIKGTLRQ